MSQEIDTQLDRLCSSVEQSLGDRAERSRRKRVVTAAQELNLKPGTRLGALAARYRELSPRDTETFETLVGAEMLFYSLNTSIGFYLAQVASDKGLNEAEYLSGLIARAASQIKQAPSARTKSKAAE